MTLIFISHVTADDGEADKLRDALAAHGLNAFVDHRDIGPSDDWTASVQKALVNCDCAVFALSPRSADNHHCINEYLHILGQKKRLYVALLETVPPAQYPWLLKRFQYADLQRDFDTGVRSLISAISGNRDLKPDDPAVASAKRITGLSDSKLLAIPMSGRDSDVSKVLSYLRQYPTTIEGIGGLGKSRLAAAVVMSDEVPGAVWLVADEYTRADDVLASLRDHFDMEADTDRRDILTRVRAYPPLMVIDNAESVPDMARPEIIRLLRELRGAGAWALLTSRKAWPGLSPDRKHTPTALSLETAAQIALDMAEVYGIPYDLKDKAEALAGAARLHPRLIELGIIQIGRGSSPEAAIRELDALRSDDTQTMLDEMLLVNVRQMVERDDPDGEAILRQLNVFRGGFTEEAAKAVLGLSDEDFDRHIRALVSWQFVKRRVDEHNRTRYEVEPLVIEVVGENKSLYQAHYDYYERLARLHDERQEYWSLEVEASNLEAAFERMMEASEVAAAFWLANAAADFLVNRGRVRQRFNWISRVDALLERGSDSELIGAVKSNLGTAYRDLSEVEEREGNLRRAIVAYTEALRFYTPDSAPLAYAMTQHNLGIAYYHLAGVEDREENLRRAIAAFTKALRFYTPASTPLDYAGTQNNLGVTYYHLADVEDRETNLRRAIDAFTKALRYSTPGSNPLDYARTQSNLGEVYNELATAESREANLQQALTALQEALHYLTPKTAPLDYAEAQQHLGVTYKALDDLPNAVRCWREAEKYYRQMGDVEKANLMLKWIEDAQDAE